jgi:GR25 family glycosyltransferase involved in LPS biosynthesis
MQSHGQMPYYVFSGVNGKKLYNYEETTPFGWTIYQSWKMEGGNHPSKRWSRYLTVGELGCAISHYWLWSDSHNQNRGITLHLEEDFIMNDWPNEQDWESLPEDWDMVLLGRQKVEGFEDEIINQYVNKPRYSNGTHAYLLSPSGQEKLANSKFLEYLVPVDEFIWGLAGTSPREDLNNLFHTGDFNIYSFNKREFIAQQSNFLSSLVEFSVNVKDIRDWNSWTDTYLNPNLKNLNFENLSSEIDVSNGVLEIPIFNRIFCEELLELLNYGYTSINKQEGVQARMPLPNVGMDRIYNKIVRDYIFPFLNWYWNTNLRNGIFANKNDAYRYSKDSTDLSILMEHESTYTMGLRLTDNEIPESELYVIPSQVGNVIIHPTILTENPKGKKFVYDSQHCILSFF